MAIPKFYELMLPVLQLAQSLNNQQEIKTSLAIQELSRSFKLTEAERYQLLPSGRGYLFANRVGWAKTYLTAAQLIESTGRGSFRLTSRGIELLNSNPAFLTVNFLRRYKEFGQFMAARVNEPSKTMGNPTSPIEQSNPIGDTSSELTPEEIVRQYHEQIQRSLATELLKRLMQLSPTAFEKVVLELVAKVFNVSANGTKHLGQSYDGGVDGVIYQDVLELDRLYIQAKRLSADTWVSAQQVREFIGSLDKHHTNKGVFVTTADFSAPARQEAIKASKNIALIHGEKLTQLMISHHVGCEIRETLHISRIDEDFFNDWNEN